MARRADLTLQELGIDPSKSILDPFIERQERERKTKSEKEGLNEKLIRSIILETIKSKLKGQGAGAPQITETTTEREATAPELTSAQNILGLTTGTAEEEFPGSVQDVETKNLGILGRLQQGARSISPTARVLLGEPRGRVEPQFTPEFQKRRSAAEELAETGRRTVTKKTTTTKRPGGLLKTPRGQIQEQVRRFNTVEEAEAANLPSGTRVIINGKSGTIQ